jgi:hypothetical protein
MKRLIATSADRRSAMFRPRRVLRNGLAVVSASALAASLMAAVPASAAKTTASPSADIAVTDSASASVVRYPSFVSFTATFTNLGPDAAQNVVMKTGGAGGHVTGLSPGVSVSCTSTSGISGITTCTTSSLPSGDWVKIGVTRQAWLCGGGDEAWATSDTFDPNLNNNTAYATYKTSNSPLFGCR